MWGKHNVSAILQTHGHSCSNAIKISPSMTLRRADGAVHTFPLKNDIVPVILSMLKRHNVRSASHI